MCYFKRLKPLQLFCKTQWSKCVRIKYNEVCIVKNLALTGARKYEWNIISKTFNRD